MDYSKETMDELFSLGNKLLTELQNCTQKKSNDLEVANKRYENLRQKLQGILNEQND